MKKHLIYLIGFLLLTTACDRAFDFGGKVVDESTGKPLENVKIFSSEARTLFTDSLGKFNFHLFGPGSNSDKLEVLVSKEGYETKYVDLSKVKDRHQIEISIKPSTLTLQPRYSPKLVEKLYWVNMYVVSVISLLTLGFILFGKIKYKWIWVLAILVVNFTLKINYIDGQLGFSAFQTPFYLKHYFFYPFTIKIALPVALILFWIGYFRKSDYVRK